MIAYTSKDSVAPLSFTVMFPGDQTAFSSGIMNVELTRYYDQSWVRCLRTPATGWFYVEFTKTIRNENSFSVEIMKDQDINLWVRVKALNPIMGVSPTLKLKVWTPGVLSCTASKPVTTFREPHDIDLYRTVRFIFDFETGLYVEKDSKKR